MLKTTISALAVVLLSLEAKSSPLAFESVFDKSEISTPAMISPDGERFSVEVVRTPSNYDVGTVANLSRSYMPSGKPHTALGSRVFVGSTIAANPIPVLNDADSWRPSWSPDGSKLAFYSDKEGKTNLWVYDVGTAQSRLVSDAVIKARPLSWLGSHARWSPDGNSVFVPVKPDGQRPPSLVDQEVDAVESNQDGAKVFLFGKDQQAENAARDDSASALSAHYLWINNADLVEINLQSGDERVIVPFSENPRPSVLRLSRSGEWLSYLSVFYRDERIEGYDPQFDLSVLPTNDRETRKPRLLSEKLPAFTPYYTNSYRWHPAEDRIVYFREGLLWTREFGSKRIGREKQLGKSLGIFAHRLLLFTRNGDSILVGAAAKNHPTNGLGSLSVEGIASFYLISLDGKTTKQIKFDQEKWEIVEFVSVDDEILWQPETRFVTIHARDRETSVNVILRIGLDDQSEQELFRWSGNLSLLNGDAQHTKAVALLEDVDTPPDLFAFDETFHGKTRITTINPQFSNVTVGEKFVLRVSVPRYDGGIQKVNVGVLMPPGAKRGDNVPAIVVFYPGIDFSATELKKFMGGAFPVPWGLYTSRGYAVVFAHVISGPGGEAGDVLKDITDSILPQVYALANAGYIDVTRLALTGNSFGGYSAAGVASRTNLFRAVIPQNAPFDISGANYGAFRDMSSSATYWQTWLERSQPRIGGHPWTDLRRVIDNSPYYQADKIVTPMLILVGSEDYFEQDAQMMYTALKRLEREVELAIYQGSGHALSGWADANAIDGAKRILSFIEEHVGPGFEPSQSEP